FDARLGENVDNVGTTKFIWTAGSQLASEDGPWASDTVTNIYNNRFRNALSLHPVRYSSVVWRLESHLPEREPVGRGSAAELSHGVKQPTGAWTNGFGFDSPREIFCSVTAGGI